MIVCGKLISYEYNSEILDKTLDLPKFYKYEQISITHSLGFMLYEISLAIPFDVK